MEIDINEQKLIELEKCRAFLDATDFYYARLAETGDLIPSDIVEKRKEAREFIRENSGISSIKQTIQI